MTGKDGKSHDGRTLLEETFNGILGIERNEAHQHETWTEEKDVELSLSLSLCVLLRVPCQVEETDNHKSRQGNIHHGTRDRMVWPPTIDFSYSNPPIPLPVSSPPPSPRAGQRGASLPESLREPIHPQYALPRAHKHPPPPSLSLTRQKGASLSLSCNKGRSSKDFLRVHNTRAHTHPTTRGKKRIYYREREEKYIYLIQYNALVCHWLAPSHNNRQKGERRRYWFLLHRIDISCVFSSLNSDQEEKLKTWCR